MAKKYFLDKRTFVNTKNLGGGLLQTSASPANTQLDLANFLDLQNYIQEVAQEVVAGAPVEIFPNGTAAAPGLTFVGDTDTGIYLVGNNILGFSVAGAKVLDVRTSQVTVSGTFVLQDFNVLLGTTTGTKLGTATTQKLGFWNATPIVQPTTAVAGATNDLFSIHT